jgi:hypothetical protein
MVGFSFEFGNLKLGRGIRYRLSSVPAFEAASEIK